MLTLEEIKTSLAAWKALESVIKLFHIENTESISFQYLLVKSDDVIERILCNDFNDIKAAIECSTIYIHDNQVFKTMKACFRRQDVNQEYSNWRQSPVTEPEQVGSIVSRELLVSDCAGILKLHDSEIGYPLLNERIEKGSSPHSFCRALYWFSECANDSIAEHILLRPIWIVLLVIRNHGTKGCRISSYEGRSYYPPDGTLFHSSAYESYEATIENIPDLNLTNNQLLIIRLFRVRFFWRHCPQRRIMSQNK